MSDEFNHKVISFADGQQVFIKDAPGFSMNVQIDDALQVDEQPISAEQFSTKSLTPGADFDTINGETTDMPNQNSLTPTLNADGII